MLKGKSKAFKPKGPVRRPAAGASSIAPSREPTREPTPREATPSLKRKEREEDVATQPSSKRVAIPPPTVETIMDDIDGSTPPTTQDEPQLPSTSTHVQQDEVLGEGTRSPEETLRSHPRRTPLPQNAARSGTTSDTGEDTASMSFQTIAPTTLPSAASRHADVLPPGLNSNPPVTSQVQIAPIRPTPVSIAPMSLADTSHDSRLSRQSSSTGARLGAAGGSALICSSGQENGTATLSTLGGAGDVGRGAVAGSQIVPMAALNPDGTSGGIIATPAEQTRRKKVVKRRTLQPEGASDQDGRATLEMQLGRPRKRLGRPSKKKQREKKKRGEREDTLSDAEDEVVDPTTLTMSALCKDLRIGKKFSRHDDIKARTQKEKADQLARRNAQDDPEQAAVLENGGADEGAAPVEGANDAQNMPSGSAAVAAEPAEPDVPIAQGRSVTMRIVDGQIVVDERSTQIDRHREAQNAQDGPMEVVEENDFTRIITAGTYMKREKTSAWDWPAMDMFYKGLRTFGTDFGMIANMFPHRSRRQIKLRFNKEERENPELIARALSAPQLPIDFEEYSKYSNKTFLETEEIHAEQAALKAEHEASLAAAENRNAAANKKKKDAIRKSTHDDGPIDEEDDDDQAGGQSAKENRAPSAGAAAVPVPHATARSREASTTVPGRRGKKATKPSRANKHSMRAGGEEVEILGTVD